MVLWGQSAGGNAANSYGYANPDDPIVAGIVAQSGTTSQINKANTTAFTILAKQFGCDGLDAEEELKCMQAVDNTMLHNIIRNGTNVPRFSPVADGVTLFANNTARLEDGQVAKVVSRLEPIFDCDANIADRYNYSLSFSGILSTKALLLRHPTFPLP
jgi:carboxylesterase type B